MKRNESLEEREIRLAKRRAYTRVYVAANKEHVRSVHKAWRKADPDGHRNRVLKYMYGITLDQYNQMCIDQDNKCLICKNQRKLVVDHDHKTGKIRGLLCINCNSRLGWLESKNIVILKYLNG